MMYAFFILLQVGFGIPKGVILIEHPDTEAVVMIGDYQRRIVSGDTLHLPVGDLQLRFGFPSYQDILSQVEIRSDRPNRLLLEPKPLKNEHERESHSVYPVVMYRANLILETDSASRFRLNGKELDSTFVALTLKPGKYRIQAIDAQGRKRTKIFNLSSTRLTYADMWAPQERDKLIRAAFLPGLSQYHRNEITKSVFFATGITALGVVSYDQIRRHRLKSNQLNDTRTAYNSVLSPDDLIILGERGERQSRELSDIKTTRFIALTSLGALYAFNIWDGRKPGRAGYRTQPPQVRPFAHPGEAGIRVSW